MSESTIFHDAATRPSHDRLTGFGVVGTYAPAHRAAAVLAADRRPDDLPLNINRVSGGFYTVSFDPEGRYAFSATAGVFVAGADGTMKLSKRTYLTVAVSMPEQWQVFLQHRAFNSRDVGAAVGLGYQRDVVSFSPPCACPRVEIEGIGSFGARSFAVLRSGGDTGGGIKISGYAGYMPRTESAVLSAAVTLGRF